MIKKILHKATQIVRNLVITNNLWYQQEFADCPKFWKNFPFNLKVVNLGSSSAFYGFDYSNIKIKGANWAIRPQSFPQDFAILKTYYSFLGPKAIVIIALCPYSSCYKSYTDISLEKYYTILHPGVIENFSLEKQSVIYDKKNRPYRLYKLQLIKGLVRGMFKVLKDIVKRRKSPESYKYQPLNEKQLEIDAMNWINGWKKQFEIEDMDAPLPTHILEGRQLRIKVLREMLSFCKERELRPVIVLPPMSQHLSSKMSENFRNNYIYSFLEEVGIKDVDFLNYIDSPDFNDADFFNSFFLNRKGAQKFTTKVLSDLKINVSFQNWRID